METRNSDGLLAALVAGFPNSVIFQRSMIL
jgi:hypothetical protein